MARTAPFHGADKSSILLRVIYQYTRYPIMKPYFIVSRVDPKNDTAHYETAAQAAQVAQAICGNTGQTVQVMQVIALATAPPPTVFWLDSEAPTPHSN